MTARTLTRVLNSAYETAQIAADLAPHLASGDVILLSGEVGAGKTHFARSLVQSLLSTGEDVPSPTFTLVQTYLLADVDVWHADLYRLTSTPEIEELGLIDAFETEICLVEWPDRLGPLAPLNALNLSISPGNADVQRLLQARWDDPRWDTKLKVWEA